MTFNIYLFQVMKNHCVRVRGVRVGGYAHLLYACKFNVYKDSVYVYLPARFQEKQ
jgi:hypothetical protein